MKHLVLLLLALLTAARLFGQPAPSVANSGITSPFHRAHVGQILFSARPVAVDVHADAALQTAAAQVNPAQELAGLWHAKRRFGPDVRGSLLVRQANGGWLAEVAGCSTAAKLVGETMSFELPDGKGAFQGKVNQKHTKIVGHWIQPATVENGTRYASPVVLVKDKRNSWRGSIAPLDDALTFYLSVQPRNDGSMGTLLKNPERNLGRLMRVDHIERDGEAVKLFAANSGNQQGSVLAEGKYDGARGMLSLHFPTSGGTFDFRRVGANEASDFYPRGRPTVPYRYAPPLSSDDGWPTASLEEVGISREGIQRFVQMLIDTPPVGSVSAPEMHGILIARRGKLVLEEYFHGEHRDKFHDTRSAAKTVASTLFGAAVKAGLPVDVSMPVYQAMNGGTVPAGLEPRKKALTVENLLTMSSGLDCDDGDPKSPGGEDVMQEGEEPDYYKFTLALKMVSEPGEKSVYCSVQPNLVGGVLQRASQQSLPVLFQNLLAGPLGIKHYYLNLTPTGDAYMGGGVRILPRDFMKLGQLHLNGGTWNGRRILTPEWSRHATSPLVELGSRKYGYYWYVQDYPYQGRTVRAFFAGGNGGQIVMGIPELELVIAFYGGSYNDPAFFIPQKIYVPQYILPTIEK